MLQACLNGNRSNGVHPRVPISPADLARDAVAVRGAGADELHVHPRDASGAETLDPDLVAAALDAIRDAAPGMPVGVGTGAWIAPGGRARLGRIERWRVLPDYASVNLNEPDCPDTMDVLVAHGVGIEAGIWNRADADRFVALSRADRCLRVLVEMTADDPALAMDEYRAVMNVLEEAGVELPVLLHGEGGSVWPMVREAARRGFDTRVGFEDGLRLPDGSTAPDNASLVSAAAADARPIHRPESRA